MEFKDVDNKLLKVFKREWDGMRGGLHQWKYLILCKDLGIEYEGLEKMAPVAFASSTFIYVNYNIINEKIWMRTKLKYGL